VITDILICTSKLHAGFNQIDQLLLGTLFKIPCPVNYI